MNKIDYRRHYVLVLDTETANTFREGNSLDTTSALAYDCGWSVVDTKGNVYEERSFVNADVYLGEKKAMETAYYAKKLPQYEEDLRSGSRKLATTYTIRKVMLEDMARYRITEVVAHNARFDYNVLNTLQRWTTKSKFRYWFPFGTEIWDTMKMARSVIHKMPTYRRFCEEHGFVHESGRLPTDAQTLYRFITKNPQFQESHTGLEDVQIEREIMRYCYRQHKKMEKVLYAKSANESPTPMQKEVMRLVRGY